jgi:ADP-ribosylglycohydrolase
MGKEKYVIGAIAGDVIGSIYERHNIKTTEFDLFRPVRWFTDDSVLTVATMYALTNNVGYTQAYKSFGKKYPYAGYGRSFREWLHSNNTEPYNSWGNGSAMRVSPVGWYCNSIDEVLSEAEKSAAVTHNHPEGIKGAQATAAAVFMARTGKSKEDIKSFITNTFDYNLDRKLDEIRPDYRFDSSCKGSVPEAIIAFLESTDFENALRLAISIGGDSDTIASIAGGIAEAFYQTVPDNIVDGALETLPQELIDVVKTFTTKYGTYNVD